MSAAELRKELKELRKSHPSYLPVSKMKKGDVSAELERLRGLRESTPAAAATPSSGNKPRAPAKASIKESKEAEHPTKPGTKKGMPRKTARPAYEGETAGKKKSKMERLMSLMAEMSDTDEE